MADDPDSTPILFTEEYRRAKRNALFWAAATLLVSLGHIQGGGREAEVDTAIGKFVFAPELLIFLSLIVLGFMFAGYVRAEGRLLARHSQFELAGDIAAEAGFAERIHVQLARAGDVAERFLRQAEDHRQSLIRYVEGMTAWAAQIPFEAHPPPDNDPIDVEAAVVTQFRDDTDVSSLSLERVRELAMLAAENVKFQSAEFSNTLLRNFTAGYPAPPPPPPELERSDEQFRAQLARTAQLSSDITSLAKTIGKGERNWFFWHDRAPVWASCGVSAAVALVRLSWATSTAFSQAVLMLG